MNENLSNVFQELYALRKKMDSPLRIYSEERKILDRSLAVLKEELGGDDYIVEETDEFLEEFAEDIANSYGE